MIEFAPETNDCMDYDRAWLYCVTCTHDNKYDWRLPTRKEYHNSPIIRSWFEAGIRSPGRDWTFYVTPVRDKDA